LENGLNRVNYCVPGLVPHLCSVLARGPDWGPAVPPYPALYVPGLAPLVPAAHAVEALAAAVAVELLAVAVEALAAAFAVEPLAVAEEPLAAVFAAEPLAVEEECGLGGLIPERVHHPVVVAAYVDQQGRPAEAALNAVAPAALDF
jgi:hypothetical protein